MKKDVAEQSRKDPFATKAKTSIWQEQSGDPNGYTVSENYCFGFSQQELIENGYSITDMLYLLTRGELPSKDQRDLFDALGIALCNPGPRHPATRSAMEAAVSKTRPQQLLPISLMVLGGEQAAGGVETAMRFLRLRKKRLAADLVKAHLEETNDSTTEQELMPGFGARFGEREPLYPNLGSTIRARFSELALPYLDRVLEIDRLLMDLDSAFALRANGLAAAVFLDLGFHPRYGAALTQWLAAPGLLAHGLEYANKPLTAMPFVAEDSYHLPDFEERAEDD